MKKTTKLKEKKEEKNTHSKKEVKGIHIHLPIQVLTCKSKEGSEE